MNNNILNGVLWTFSGTGIQVILQFLVFIILSRLLEPESFGVMSTGLAVITVLAVFSKIGIGPSLVQKENIKEIHIQTGFSLSLAFSVIITILVYNTSGFTASFFNMAELEPILKVLAFVHIVQGFSIVPEALLQRELQFKKLAVVQMVSYLTYGIIGVTLSVAGLEVWALVYAYISHSIVKTLLMLLYKSYSKKLSLNIIAAKELLIFGSGYSVGSIYNQIALQGDTLVIGKFLGASSLGIYSRAYQFFSIPVNLIGTVIEKVLFPSFSRMQSEKSKIQKTYKETIALVGIVCLPFSLLFFILAEDIILLLFGEKWLQAVLPFKILILGLLPRVSYKISDSLTKSLGKVFKSANRKLVYGISIILGVSIGQVFGLVGACVGVVVAVLINYVYMAQIALSLSKLKWRDFVIAHTPCIYLTVISILPTIILYNIVKIFELNSFYNIVTVGGIFFIIISITVYVTPQFLFRDYRKLIIDILRKMKIKDAK